MIKDIIRNREMITELARNDFRKRFAGSYLGVFWAFVQPIITVLIYWFVFQVGFKSAPIKDFPYVMWLIIGIVPWFFFSEVVLNGMNAFLEYSYLVKKVVFKVSILPMVKAISAVFVHLFFVFFATVVFILYGYSISPSFIQIIYYSFCAFVLGLALSYITSPIIIFFKDLGQLMNIVLQIGIWLTPIMWSSEIMPEVTREWFKINPMYYVVEGYRDSFIDNVWFWEKLGDTVYFWVVIIVLTIIGKIVYSKLKPHFSDIL